MADWVKKPIDMDDLVRRTGLSAQAIAAQLTALEIDGLVAPVPGAKWQRRR